VFGPEEGAATVSVVTAPDYATRCPNVSKLMSNLKFTAAQESQMMVPIMDRKAPADVAKAWLKNHPEDLQRWLAGVTTFDGKDAMQAVQVAVNK
jgi:glycine betaine/proline transport system substrate-binding protein